MENPGHPPIPFTPAGPAFPGWDMPASVPQGMRMELSRARLLDGAESSFDDWMEMLHERYEEFARRPSVVQLKQQLCRRYRTPPGTAGKPLKQKSPTADGCGALLCPFVPSIGFEPTACCSGGNRSIP